MQVEVRLLAGLERYVPGAVSAEPLSVDLEETGTVKDLLDRLGIGDRPVMAIVNGRRQDPDFQLSRGDRVGLFPPVGGGQPGAGRDIAAI